jgi:hypothetical protein
MPNIQSQSNQPKKKIRIIIPPIISSARDVMFLSPFCIVRFLLRLGVPAIHFEAGLGHDHGATHPDFAIVDASLGHPQPVM